MRKIRTELQNLSAENEDFAMCNDELRAKMKTESEQAAARRAMLEATLNDLKTSWLKDTEQHQKEVSGLNDQLNGLTAANASLQQSNKSELALRDVQTKALTQRLLTLENELEAFQSDEKKSTIVPTGEMGSLEQRCAELEELLKTNEEKWTNLVSDLDSVLQERSERLRELETSNMELNSKISELQFDQFELGDYHRSLDRYKTQIKELSGRNRQLESNLAKLDPVFSMQENKKNLANMKDTLLKSGLLRSLPDKTHLNPTAAKLLEKPGK